MSKPAPAGCTCTSTSASRRSGKAHEGKAKVRTGLGKTDRPGSQGGLWKHGDYGSRTEGHRETDGLATVPYDYARATFLSRLSMSEGIVWAYEDESVEQAAMIMSERQVRRLPVVDRDKRLVGIVALGDFAVESSEIRPAAQALSEISRPSEPSTLPT